MRTRAEIRSILTEYRSSGLTQRTFAASRGIALSTFAYWLQKDRAGGQEARPEPDPAPDLIPVQIVPSAKADEVRIPILEVLLGNDRIVRVPADFDADALARLLPVVDSPC